MSGLKNSIYVGSSNKGNRVEFSAKMANRHGLICGATGTGKTVTLQVLVENFSRLGVPVVVSDVKGDLSGLSTSGVLNEKIEKRLKKLNITDFDFSGCPTIFWDVFGEKGHRIRTTISEMGPLLLTQLLSLNDTQSGVLDILFRVSDEEGLLLLDLKDLREMLLWVGDNSSSLRNKYGNISTSSVGAIQRKLLSLEDRGGEFIFGEPALNIKDLMRKDLSGRGIVNIFDATKLIQDPQAYVTLLLWLLSELFEELEEVGDRELPKLVFFFDEAHLLFDKVSDVFIEKVERVVKLIRSKGVGVFFITQNPVDIPDSICSQLGNRFQHALRAFTPKEQKSVKVAANSFRANPDFNSYDAILELKIGEALVSTLDKEGSPGVVERTLISPPSSKLGPISEEKRNEVISYSPIGSIYEKDVDRESAYEVLVSRKEELKKEKSLEDKASTESNLKPKKEKRTSSRRQSTTEAFVKSMLRSVGSSIGRRIVRGILGSFR